MSSRVSAPSGGRAAAAARRSSSRSSAAAPPAPPAPAGGGAPAADSEQEQELPARILERYRLTPDVVLGAGAFAKIFKAVDKHTNETVALKVMRRSSYRKRCLESQIDIECALIRECGGHRNVVSVYEIVDDGELVVMPMPCATVDLQRATQGLKKRVGESFALYQNSALCAETRKIPGSRWDIRIRQF